MVLMVFQDLRVPTLILRERALKFSRLRIESQVFHQDIWKIIYPLSALISTSFKIMTREINGMIYIKGLLMYLIRNRYSTNYNFLPG